MSERQLSRIVVISMRDSAERRRRFAQRAVNADVQWSWFDGCAGLVPGLFYDESQAKLRWGRGLTAGEIGCYASHYSLWKQLLEDDADQYVILEDDVIVDWAFLQALVEFDLHRSGIDYLRLHCLRPGAMRVRQYGYFGTKQLVQLREPAYGTQGYVITRAGAQRLAEYCSRVLCPVDSQLDRYWEHGLANLCLFPFPIIEEFGESTIGAERRDWSRRPLPVRVRGKLRSIVDQARRRVWLLKRR